MWDPAAYHRFGNERSRPFADLMARVGAEHPRAVADLGCGTGELTETLAERWPRARVAGLDSSAEMIATAGARGGRAEFRLGDLAQWRPDPDTDVVVTNAALQWVPGHGEMLSRWIRTLPPGAWLALQVPGNFDAHSHRLLREVARSRPYAAVLGDLVREAPVDDAAGYANRLLAEGARVDAWETTYVHLLSAAGDDHPVLRWMEGTALRPVKAALDGTAWRAFRATLGAKLAAVYPTRSGMVAFPFRRIFVVAHVQEEK
ncbi:trans-aconitate 2-methyltransferase [Couchioplanes caeruleus]|uniref:Trans-aconitate methyltransferase n=2 Tax=Couchioplanes caeruleus TaxID=56438 RepID=A0A1K0GKQ1_9ACTN|nr:trans-aconitate 2-methyltransferase [Couchioplanes caeruleus]OJF12862.1 trans-aconitate methyltransferase [Couchioplanes caeruleus subsp. caeruleus]ROP33226.1 trans-aconitate 2-methyltransferase [Couchioplanes caeruleus]